MSKQKKIIPFESVIKGDDDNHKKRSILLMSDDKVLKFAHQKKLVFTNLICNNDVLLLKESLSLFLL